MPLSEAQRQHLEQLLKEERARAMRALNRSLTENSEDDEQDRSGDLTLMPFHPADLGTDTMQAELDAANDARRSSASARTPAPRFRTRGSRSSRGRARAVTPARDARRSPDCC